MPTFGQLIDEAIESQNAGGSQVDDSSMRLRYAHAGQRVSDAAWHFRPYARRLARGTVAIASNADGIGLVPSDFSSAGDKLRVYIQNQRRDVTYRAPQELFDMRERWTEKAQWPDFYTFAGQSVGVRNGIKGGLLQLVVSRRPTGAITLVLEDYVAKSPKLIDRPSRPVGAATGVGNVDAGSYLYRVAFSTANDITEPGAISDPVVVADDQQVALTSIAVSPVSTVTSRVIFRTLAGGSTFYQLATINDNTTTTYTDNIDDTVLVLNAAAPTPANCSTGLEMFPEDFHRTAILAAIIELMARNEGDGRSAGELSASAMKGLAQMWAEEKITHVRRRMPAYGARANYFGRRP